MLSAPHVQHPAGSHSEHQLFLRVAKIPFLKDNGMRNSAAAYSVLISLPHLERILGTQDPMMACKPLVLLAFLIYLELELS